MSVQCVSDSTQALYYMYTVYINLPTTTKVTLVKMCVVWPLHDKRQKHGWISVRTKSTQVWAFVSAVAATVLTIHPLSTPLRGEGDWDMLINIKCRRTQALTNHSFCRHTNYYVRVAGGAGANPSTHWKGGRVHSVEVISPSQG